MSLSHPITTQARDILSLLQSALGIPVSATQARYILSLLQSALGISVSASDPAQGRRAHLQKLKVIQLPNLSTVGMTKSCF